MPKFCTIEVLMAAKRQDGGQHDRYRNLCRPTQVLQTSSDGGFADFLILDEGDGRGNGRGCTCKRSKWADRGDRRQIADGL